MRNAFLVSVTLASLCGGTAFAGNACTCVGDLDGDGFIGGADLGVLLQAWGLGAGPADLDGSGAVDGADLGLLLSLWGPCGAPSNDVCTSPAPLALGDTPFCTLNASTELPAIQAPLCGSGDVTIAKDIWYSYTPIGAGTLELSTCNQADFDTAMAVWRTAIPGLAACPTGGVGLAILAGCNDDAIGCGGFTSSLEVDVIAGQPYRIQLGGFFSASGIGTLSATFTSVGSACFLARAIPSNTDTAVFVGTTADNPFGVPNLDACGVEGSPAEWFSWTAPCDSVVVVTTCTPGTNYDTTIHVYRDSIGQGCDGILVDCNDDNPNPACVLPNGLVRKSRVEFLATSGVTYNIRIGGYQGASGTFELLFERECF